MRNIVIRWIETAILFFFLIFLIFVNQTVKKPIKTQEICSILNLHNGDAKFIDDKIITSVGGKLTLINFEGEIVKEYSEINSNWLSLINKERVIIYGNFNNEIGIVKLNKDFNIEYHQIIMKTDNLQIDPTITKANDTYYITVTEIIGNINNSDINSENGQYIIHLFSSKDLKQWDYISDVVSEKNNIEDVDLQFVKDHFVISYEFEELDKGNSCIKVQESRDEYGKVWNKPILLLEADCDHEPVSFISIPNGQWKLYYSSDKNEIKNMYMGKIYFAIYDDCFACKEKDIEIETQTKKGILCYDVTVLNNTEYFLYARDYLGECDLVVEGSIESR